MNTNVTLKPKKLLKSITMSSIRTNPGAAKTTDAPVLLAVLFGQVTGIKKVENPRDPSEIFDSLLGQFEAINMQNGEVYGSGVCYLPSTFQDMVVEQVKAAEKALEGASNTATIEIAYEIHSVKATSPAGYTYQLTSLADPRVSDPMAKLRNELLSGNRSAALSELVPAPAQLEAPAPAQLEAPQEAAKKAKK